MLALRPLRRTPILIPTRLSTLFPPSPIRTCKRGLMAPVPPMKLPQCWGHRGASSRYPENTLASFEAAIRDGADGIESDVHVSLDDVVVMFHDPDLRRTTDSQGQIRERRWYGAEGMEHVRTRKEPHQAIPTFAETIALLMLPENQHVGFNVDVKVQNDPARLFALMHSIISSQPEWETRLAPRILLGLWHPSFIDPAKEFLPYCRRSHIGDSPSLARTYFWKDCDVFSMAFGSLTSADGERFRHECKAEGKEIMVWTVNDPNHMTEATRWGVDVILTDKTQTWLALRTALSNVCFCSRLREDLVSTQPVLPVDDRQVLYSDPVHQAHDRAAPARVRCRPFRQTQTSGVFARQIGIYRQLVPELCPIDLTPISLTLIIPTSCVIHPKDNRIDSNFIPHSLIHTSTLDIYILV
ncbi:unnamed protein product [Mycena citricolor]|uniref:GP-PDE domain-containing protein n=2 Tax=Mycena citricolor TaxID=2018698 RepID=A0AAD2GTM4_9AGAR|nr:unnamed protein product [Mycena citricolor]